MPESYENLAGASGRARFFRPRRYNAAELFSGAPPRLLFENEEFDLENISLRGAGCIGRLSGSNENLPPAGATGLLRLTQLGKEIFCGPARKARASVKFASINAGFELESEEFDLHGLVRENACVLAAQTGPVADSSLPPSEYKSFCAETAAFIGGYLQRIDKHISPIEGTLGENERNSLARNLADAAKPQWKGILETGNALVARNAR